MMRFALCAVTVAMFAVPATGAEGEQWEVKWSRAPVRTGARLHSRGVLTYLAKGQHIRPTGRSRNGRWLKARVQAEDQPVEGWVCKRHVRLVRTQPVEADTPADEQTTELFAGAAIRGLRNLAKRMIVRGQLDMAMAKWILQCPFTIEQYEAFRSMRAPDTQGTVLARPGEEDGLTDVDPDKQERLVRLGALLTTEEVRGRTIGDARLNAYLTMVASLLGESCARSDTPFRVILVDDDGVNSYSRPGGVIVVTTGLVKLCQDEAELAAAVAHEIGHLARDHSLKEAGHIERETGIGIVRMESELDRACRKLGWNDWQTMDPAVVRGLEGELNWFRGVTISRERRLQEEREADEFALIYLARSGYDPDAFRSSVAQLAQRSDAGPNWGTPTHYDDPRRRLEFIDQHMRRYGLQPRPDRRFAEPYRREVLDRLDPGRARSTAP